MICARSALAALALSVLTMPVLPFANAGAAQAAADADNAYLEELLGKWDMTGWMGSKALHYHAVGERVLQDGFLRLHMIDAAADPKYEADVFIGVDSAQHDFVAHWLDRFGAAGARVVGTGKRNNEQLIVMFPYASGNFRDTFTFVPSTGTWSLLLESQKQDGSWSTFATYSLARAH
jgi:hypothetical protein